MFFLSTYISFIPFMSGVLCLLFHFFFCILTNFVLTFSSILFLRCWLFIFFLFFWVCVSVIYVLWLIDSSSSWFNVGHNVFIMHMLAFSFDFCSLLLNWVQSLWAKDLDIHIHTIPLLWSIFHCCFFFIPFFSRFVF